MYGLCFAAHLPNAQSIKNFLIHLNKQSRCSQAQLLSRSLQMLCMHADMNCMWLQFNTALQANTWSSFNILKGAVKAMMKNQKGGSIVFTSASGAALSLLVVLHIAPGIVPAGPLPKFVFIVLLRLVSLCRSSLTMHRLVPFGSKCTWQAFEWVPMWHTCLLLCKMHPTPTHVMCSGGGRSIVSYKPFLTYINSYMHAVAHTGVANHDAIAAAKGAVAGLTTGASATYAPHNIRINCIAPGLVSSTSTTAPMLSLL